MSNKLNVWVLYENIADFPGQFVARRFEERQPTGEYFSNTDIELVRGRVRDEIKKVNQGDPYRLPRQPHDDPVILERWT